MDTAFHWKDLRLSEYEYTLPEDRIAKFPLDKRDSSKLLHYHQGTIGHLKFGDLPQLIPKGSLMVFNDTKVIPARLVFHRENGGKIEIFLLKPVKPSTVISEVMTYTDLVCWETMIGNLKKWKPNEILTSEIWINNEKIILTATLLDKQYKIVKFTWTGTHIPFVSIVEATGEVPLPPYLKRKATQEDKPRYQTVYSRDEGAVAAPTAGLHFTDEILEKLLEKGIKKEFITLHVGAGTFQPIKVEEISMHNMHSEQVVATKSTIQTIAKHDDQLIAVGTTSMRSLESLYWFGVMLLRGETAEFKVPKLYPYQEFGLLPSRQESFNAISKWMEDREMEDLIGSTEIFIMPGYKFMVCQGLVTNFHQPSSTLILLVAAFTNGNWRKIYNAALDNGYRFLSYGDSSLIWQS